MTRIWLFGVLLGSLVVAEAAEKPEYVSQTFQEIQNRVVRRDAESGAILGVKVKEDAPRLGFALDFSIDEELHTNEVVIILKRNLKTGDDVFERYRLRVDAAMRQELINQKKYKVLETQRLAKAVEEQKKQIIALSGGKLKYGSTIAEVIKVKGEPRDIPPIPAGGYAIYVYDDMTLRFYMDRLLYIELHAK